MNPLHFIACSAVYSQMSCTTCLSKKDIQMPNQISVPCTTPYFHKDTLTPPSSSRSPPLEGGGPNMYVAHNAFLYNAHLLLQALHLEGIQLMSIARYEAFVSVRFFVYKTLCAALHMASVGCRYMFILIGVGTGGALGACAPPTFTCLPRPHNNFARVNNSKLITTSCAPPAFNNFLRL